MRLLPNPRKPAPILHRGGEGNSVDRKFVDLLKVVIRILITIPETSQMFRVYLMKNEGGGKLKARNLPHIS